GEWGQGGGGEWGQGGGGWGSGDNGGEGGVIYETTDANWFDGNDFDDDDDGDDDDDFKDKMTSPLPNNGDQKCIHKCGELCIVYKEWLCDDIEDCKDGSDEKNCSKDNKRKKRSAKHGGNLKQEAGNAMHGGNLKHRSYDHDTPETLGMNRDSKAEWLPNSEQRDPEKKDNDDSDDDKMDREKDNERQKPKHNGRRPRNNGYNFGQPSYPPPHMQPGNMEMQKVAKIAQNIFLRLMVSNPEDTPELSFIPLSVRKDLKEAIAAVTAKEGCSLQRAVNIMMWNGVMEPVMTMMQQKLIDEGGLYSDTKTKVNEVFEFFQSNVSVEAKKLFNSSDDKALVDLMVDYSSLMNDNSEAIVEIVTKCTTTMLSAPEEIQLLSKTPGAEPDEDTKCLRAAVKGKAEEQSGAEEKLVTDPFETIMSSMQKKSTKPVYWKMQKDGAFRGERSSLTGSMFWEKIATCSCSATCPAAGRGMGGTGFGG
ncbi:unnamed protein product, partial [Meganyctiphanes norvegica]